MANDHDISAPRRKLLVPVMALLLIASCALAWWYGQGVSRARHRAAAAIVADVRSRGLASYVEGRHNQVHWFRRIRLTETPMVGPTGTVVIVPVEVTIGWRAVVMISLGDGTFGWLEAQFDKSGRSTYEGQWHRWSLSNDTTSGRLYSGSLTIQADNLDMEGALLVEFAPETVAIHHGWPAETVERITVGDAFLPPGTLPLATSAMQARKSGGIFELFDSSLGPDGWSAGVYELALSVTDQADAPADLQGAADTAVIISMPGNGMQIGRIYFNSRGDVLGVDAGDVRERLALTGNRLLASLGLGPPKALRDVFPERIWQGTQQLLDELADSQRAGE